MNHRVADRSLTSGVSSVPGPLMDLVSIFSLKKEEDGRRLLKFTFASSSFMVHPL